MRSLRRRVALMYYFGFGEVKINSRGKNKTAVSTAAYQAAAKIKNEITGEVYDYTRKKDVGDTFIRMPKGAPARWTDESIPVVERLADIWNTVEKENTASNARLSRSSYISFQKRLSLEENIECLEKWIKINCTDVGMGVTYSLHLADGNDHADLQFQTQQYDEDGHKKQRRVKYYKCRNANGEERELLPEQLEAAPEFEKIYQYVIDNKIEKLTPSEAEARGLTSADRKNKYPVSRSARLDGFDDKDMVERWRKSWEKILNEKFVEKGLKYRVSADSYEKQGIEKIPQKHVGRGKGMKAREELNEQIKDFNIEKEQFYNIGKNAYLDIEAQIKELKKPISEEQLENQRIRFEENKEVLEFVSNSDLFFDKTKNKFKAALKDVSERFEALFNLLKELFEKQKKERSASEHTTSSLGDLIENANKPALEKPQKSQKNDLEI